MLKIKDNVDLKELEKFGFVYYQNTKANNNYPKFNNGFKTYLEKGYRLDDGTNTCEIVEQRINSNWFDYNEEREVHVFESDYEMGVSDEMIDVIYDLIQAGLVEKVD
jgi:hypothetical protein